MSGSPEKGRKDLAAWIERQYDRDFPSITPSRAAAISQLLGELDALQAENDALKKERKRYRGALRRISLQGHPIAKAALGSRPTSEEGEPKT